MNEFVLHWLIALAAILLLFGGLYLVIRMAVRTAVREAVQELLRDMAKELWKNETER